MGTGIKKHEILNRMTEMAGKLECADATLCRSMTAAREDLLTMHLNRIAELKRHQDVLEKNAANAGYNHQVRLLRYNRVQAV